jgi:hypothetical protein
LQQLVPGLDEPSRSFDLKLVTQNLNVNAGLGESGQHFLTFAGTRGDAPVNLSMIGQGLQGCFWHGVYSEGRGKGMDIECVGGIRILGAGASPEESLGSAPCVEDAFGAG